MPFECRSCGNDVSYDPQVEIIRCEECGHSVLLRVEFELQIRDNKTRERIAKGAKMMARVKKAKWTEFSGRWLPPNFED